MAELFAIRKQVRRGNPMNKKIVVQSSVKFGDFLLENNSLFQSNSKFNMSSNVCMYVCM
jgi:hypothetical protein